MHLSLLYNVGKFQSPSSNTFQDRNYFLVNYFLVIYGPVQTTDRKRRIWAQRAKCTGGLKNQRKTIAILHVKVKYAFVFFPQFLLIFRARIQFWKCLDLKQTIYFMWPRVISASIGPEPTQTTRPCVVPETNFAKGFSLHFLMVFSFAHILGWVGWVKNNPHKSVHELVHCGPVPW